MALVSQSIHSVRRLISGPGARRSRSTRVVAVLQSLCRASFSLELGIKVEVRGKDILEMPKSFETALFRVLQGALSNVAKHSKAKRVKVNVRTVKESVIQMTIEDNGIGFVATKRNTKETFWAYRHAGTHRETWRSIPNEIPPRLKGPSLRHERLKWNFLSLTVNSLE